MWFVTYTVEGNPNRSIGVIQLWYHRVALQVEEDLLVFICLFFSQIFYESEHGRNIGVDFIWHSWILYSVIFGFAVTTSDLCHHSWETDLGTSGSLLLVVSF